MTDQEGYERQIQNKMDETEARRMAREELGLIEEDGVIKSKPRFRVPKLIKDNARRVLGSLAGAVVVFAGLGLFVRSIQINMLTMSGLDNSVFMELGLLYASIFLFLYGVLGATTVFRWNSWDGLGEYAFILSIILFVILGGMILISRDQKWEERHFDDIGSACTHVESIEGGLTFRDRNEIIYTLYPETLKSSTAEVEGVLIDGLIMPLSEAVIDLCGEKSEE